MAKYVFEKEFELEVGDKVYKGSLKNLSKKEKESLEAITKAKKASAEKAKKLIRKAKKLQRKIEIAEKQDKWDKVETLEEELEKLETDLDKFNETHEDDEAELEIIHKKRLEMSLISDNKQEILNLGEQYSYQNVFETILKSTNELAEGK